MTKTSQIVWPLGAGLVGSLLLTGLYFGIVSIAESPSHAVDLSMDLASLATLTSSNGLNLPGTTWDAPRGGHHVSGLLIFNISDQDLTLLNEANHLS